MSFYRSRIQRQRHGVLAEPGQGFEDGAPSAALGPAIEAIVDCRVGTVFPRAIAPSCARLQHVDDAADDTPVVLALRPSQTVRQMWFQTLPLPIIQPKQTWTHSPPPRINSQTENHHPLIRYRP